MHDKYFVIHALYQTCKGICRNFPVWLSTPINNPPKSGDQQNKKGYGDPPDLFSAVTKQKRKKAGDETRTNPPRLV